MEAEKKHGKELLIEMAKLRERAAELDGLELERQLTMRRLYESQEQFRLITDALPTIISYVDFEQRYRFNNRAYEEWFGLRQTELHGRHIREVLGETGYQEIRDYVEMALSGKTLRHERAVLFKDGTQRYIEAVYVPHIGQSGEVKGFFSLGVDITERTLAAEVLQRAHDELEKRIEERTAQLRKTNEKMMREIEERKRIESRLRYNSMHDALTGLHNRSYFEECLERIDRANHIRIGMVVCDLDGLKLVNDSLGHDVGDRLLVAAADIIRKCARDSDTVARIGGDEFALLLRNCEEATVERIAQKIKRTVAGYNAENANIPLSISVGIAINSTLCESMADLFRVADNNMYREKLLSSRSARNAILQTLMRALEARDFVTEGHVNRLQEMVSRLASVVGLPESRVSALRLLAQFHDIGKVGVPDLILFKPGPLSIEEAEQMRRHCEIGHRIALASPDLTGIADWILAHHEWWNGSGYPFGLQGNEIPLECRILAVADAYDAMTNIRPYRKPLRHREAVTELERCAGSQFDPELITKFTPKLSHAKGRRGR